jgi:hypothetical protein
MNDGGNDSYQEGRSGSQSTGSTVVDAIEYSRGRRDAEGGQGGGMLVAIVVLSPFICLTYPFVGLLTVGAALLVPRVAPVAGIKSGSGVLIVVTLVAIVAAFLGGIAAERKASKSKAYRIVRWIMRILLVPGMLVYALLNRGTQEVNAGILVVPIIMMVVGVWFLKGLDRFLKVNGES